MLDILEDLVKSKGYDYVRLDGTTSATERGKRVDQFNKKPSVFLFLLSTRAGGVGINLVSASKVVIFEPSWNPANDMQAMDRSFRIGQRQDVHVYRFVASNTVEEKVYQRQLYKQSQEGLALKQQDETRLFEGVMGDKTQKGELFGVQNLLQFAGSSTAAILSDGRSGIDADGEEGTDGMERGEHFVIRKATWTRDMDDDDDDGDDDADDEDDPFGGKYIVRKLKLDGSAVAGGKSSGGVSGRGGRGGRGGGVGGMGGSGSAAEEPLSAAAAAELLLKSGAVHSPMHNAVLGGAALADLETKGALDVGNGVAVAQAALPPKRGVKREAQAPLGAAAAGGAAPHATHKRMPSAWPPTPPASLEECLGGCVTRPAFLSLLQRDEMLAWRVEYALQELQQGEQLCQLIDALPDLEHPDYDAALQVPRSAGAGPSGAPPTPPPSPPGSPSPSRTTVDPPSEPPAAEALPLVAEIEDNGQVVDEHESWEDSTVDEKDKRKVAADDVALDRLGSRKAVLTTAPCPRHVAAKRAKLDPTAATTTAAKLDSDSDSAATAITAAADLCSSKYLGTPYKSADDKQRAYDAIVNSEMRNALLARARTLVNADPCGLRALQVVDTDEGLWIHVVLRGYKQRVSCAVLRALQGSEEPLFGREKWCLPRKSLLDNDGTDHNVERVRDEMKRAGRADTYAEISGDGKPRSMLLPSASDDANEVIKAFAESERSTAADGPLQISYEELLRILQELSEEELLRFLQESLPECATPDESGGPYRSLGDTSMASRLARVRAVRAELAQHLPRLRALE